MCSRPCWPTPEEANKLIQKGYANKLMLDYWNYYEDDWGGNIEILCPANPGYEGEDAPSTEAFSVFDMLSPTDLTSGCIMQNEKTGLCELHDKKLKPIEGRLNHHSEVIGGDDIINQTHEAVAMLWKSKEGLNIINKWKKEVEY